MCVRGRAEVRERSRDEGRVEGEGVGVLGLGCEVGSILFS